MLAGVVTARRTARAEFPGTLGTPGYDVYTTRVLTLYGIATLLHLLVVSVTRRRQEMGLLKTLGFLRRQVAFCVSWQATTVALTGIVIGVPAGIAAGRFIWRAFATSLGVPPAPVVVAWVIAAMALGTLITANTLAAGPALVATRSRPASLLRTG